MCTLLALVACSVRQHRAVAVAAEAGGVVGMAIKSAVIFREYLICLYGDGRVATWRIRDWQADEPQGRRMTLSGLRQLGSDGRDLYGITDLSLVHWSPA